jgi:DNA-binding transcriptional ArsR family regulator
MPRGAKTSEAMLRARKMIESSRGKASAYSVAQATGLTRGAITRSKWYRDYMDSLPAEVNALETAKRLVAEGKTKYAAAKLTGVSQSTIGRHIKGESKK